MKDEVREQDLTYFRGIAAGQLPLHARFPGATVRTVEIYAPGLEGSELWIRIQRRRAYSTIRSSWIYFPFVKAWS